MGPGILMPQGKVNSLTPSQQVAVYLNRLRYTVPFPVTPEQTYFGCMPEVIFRMHVEGLLDPLRVVTGKVGNLLSCLTRSGADKPNIIHIHLDDTTVFWLEVLPGLPTPLYRRANTIEMPPDHPHAATIKGWVGQCVFIEHGIQRAMAAVTKAEGHCQSGSTWNAAWPEIMNFINCKKVAPISANAAKHLRERVLRECRAAEMEFTTELLATAVMLPDKKARLNAWVNFHSEEYSHG